MSSAERLRLTAVKEPDAGRVAALLTRAVPILRAELKSLVDGYGNGKIEDIDERWAYSSAVEMREIVSLAEAALSGAPASPWLPIETAPKDGTRILSYDDEDLIEVIRWCVCDDEWVTVSHPDDRGSWTGVTHWMPLPPPPSKEGA